MNGFNSDSTDRINQQDYIKDLEEENKKYKKFINRLIHHTNTQMQDYMVQAVYDQFNKQCTDFILELNQRGER